MSRLSDWFSGWFRASEPPVPSPPPPPDNRPLIEQARDRINWQRIAPQGLVLLYVGEDQAAITDLTALVEHPNVTLHTLAPGPDMLDGIKAVQPEMVFLDIPLAWVQEQRFIAQIHSDPATISIPVFAFYTRGQYPEIREGDNNMPDIYLTKPYNPIELAQFITRILSPS